MKNIIVLISLLHFFAVNVVAQDANSYVEVPQFNKFVGDWIYTINGKDLILHLSKKKVYVKQAKSSVDVIEGYYEFKKGKQSSAEDKVKNKIEAGRLEDASGSVITFFISDPSKGKRGAAVLEIVPNNPNQMKLTIKETEGIKVRKGSNSGFTLPSGIILRKI